MTTTLPGIDSIRRHNYGEDPGKNKVSYYLTHVTLVLLNPKQELAPKKKRRVV
jgi:hypothetical protein